MKIGENILPMSGGRGVAGSNPVIPTTQSLGNQSFKKLGATRLRLDNYCYSVA